MRTLLWPVTFMMLASCIPSDLEPSELAGHWQLLAESQDDLDSPYQSLSPRLTLNEDCTFVVEELPGEMLYLTEPWRTTPVSGSGRWKIEDREYSLQGNTVAMTAKNDSTIASLTRPPVLGYTKAWKSLVGDPLNSMISSGPLSTTRQQFDFTVPCP